MITPSSVFVTALTLVYIVAMILAPAGLWEKLPWLFWGAVALALFAIGLSGAMLSGKIK